MWIECENPHMTSVYNRDLMGDHGAVEFKNGRAKVSAELGKRMVALYPSIHAVKEKKAAKSKEVEGE